MWSRFLFQNCHQGLCELNFKIETLKYVTLDLELNQNDYMIKVSKESSFVQTF